MNYFSYSFVLKTGLNLINFIRSKNKRWIFVILNIVSNTFKFSLSMAAIATLYKLMMCTIRSYRNVDDNPFTLFAALLVCFAFVFDRSRYSKLAAVIAVCLRMFHILLSYLKDNLKEIKSPKDEKKDGGISGVAHSQQGDH